MKILYIDSFTRTESDSEASDEIGYGITSSEVIKKYLRKSGAEIISLKDELSISSSKMDWVIHSYRILNSIDLVSFDLIFIFHSFHQFPCEIRRILLSRNIIDLPIVGYIHGSHWDKSDSFREEQFPNLKYQDLANMICMDQIFLVSNYFKRLLVSEISKTSPKISEQLEGKMIVTGLPFHKELIDQNYADKLLDSVNILFNHSPTFGKNPQRFFEIMNVVMESHDIILHVSRKFSSGNPGYGELNKLRWKYSSRVNTYNTLNIDNYFKLLWKTNVQISTAEHESLGVSTIEAMYTRNCCLVPNRLCYPELHNGDNLYADDRMLITKIELILKSETYRKGMSEELHKASLKYSPAVVIDKLINSMSSIL